MVCPDGTVLKGAPPPELFAMGCERPDGKKYGPFKTWHKNGQMSESGAYNAEGKLDGMFTAWNDKGQKLREGKYLAGEFDGPWTRWHETGEKSDEGKWSGGRPTGTWTFWHPNGQKKAHGDYGPTGEVGAWTFWTDSGALREKGAFEDGEKVCEWTQWDAKTQEPTQRWEKRNANCPEPSQADAAAGGAPGRQFKLGVFEVGGLASVQPTAGASYTGTAAWAPRLIWGNGFRILVRVGTLAYRISGGSLAWVLDYGAGVGFAFPWFGAARPLQFEATFGSETWVGYNLFALKGRGAFFWKFSQPVLRFIDRLFVSYSMVYSGANSVHTGTVGVSATFF